MMPVSFCIDTQTWASASTLKKAEERSDVEFPRIENVLMYFLSSVY